MGAKEISLKLLVHRERTQILYAESEQDFVDVLFSFLTMPIGTIIRLTAEQTKIGCMSTLYESMKDLNVKYLQSEECKNMLLHPKNAAEDHCRDLVVNIDDRGPTEYYLCDGSIPFSTDVKHLISTNLSDKLCRCGVKVSPVCTRTSLELLKRFGINDASVLEERNVNLGSEEVFHLLKHSLLSKTPLTDVFLPVQDSISLFNQCNIPISDLEERVVSVGDKEALSLLKASLTSQTVLSDVFLKKPKRSSLYS
ncbi:hypothetical protein AAC387_Pa12g1357 [Persea americana]